MLCSCSKETPNSTPSPIVQVKQETTTKQEKPIQAKSSSAEELASAFLSGNPGSSGEEIYFVDVRTQQEFDKGHIPGAIRIPDLKDFSEKPDIIVAYGDKLDDSSKALLEKTGAKAVLAPDALETYRKSGRQLAKTMDTNPLRAFATQKIKDDDVKVVEAQKLRLWMKKGEKMTICYVGNEDVYQKNRIPGAIYVPAEKCAEHFKDFSKDSKIVFYCGCCTGRTIGLSGYAAKALMELGFTDVYHLEGHLQAWMERGYDVETGSK